jgi:hypothetical protein
MSRGLRAPVRLYAGRRWIIYIAGIGVWLTGVLWLVFHDVLQRQTEFGAQPHPLEFWWRAAHGFLSFAAVWTFGLVWGSHVVGAWKTGRHRVSGIAVFAILAWLCVSGYLLYYVGNDKALAVISLAHWVAGLMLPAVFVAHRWFRRTS